MRTKPDPNRFHRAYLLEMVVVAFLLTACIPAQSLAKQGGQKTFSSAEDACNALVTATRNNDQKAMLEILGQDGRQIVMSGDDSGDAESRANFVKRYEEMHRLVKEPDETTVLYIGAHNWPCPIPLVKKGKAWSFDTKAGKKDILFRRIGRNELSTIRVCQELAAAEKEFRSTHHNEYARKIFSTEGQHDGLYWKAAGGEPGSPIGPLVASAVTGSDARDRAGASTPFRGYFFRILPRPGGFAFLAYPAEYRSSGVMTFLVGEDGVVYEKDLGRKTGVLARGMKGYNPNSGWRKVELQPEESAGEQKTR